MLTDSDAASNDPKTPHKTLGETVGAFSQGSTVMVRRIVQIASGAEADGHLLYALADDGTVWKRVRGKRSWEPVECLPPRGDDVDHVEHPR